MPPKHRVKWPVAEFLAIFDPAEFLGSGSLKDPRYSFVYEYIRKVLTLQTVETVDIHP